MILNRKKQTDLYNDKEEYDNLIDDPTIKDKEEDEFLDSDDPLDSDFGSDLTDDFGDGMTQNPLEKHNDLLKSLTNFDPYLKDTFNNWLGLSWDEETSTYKRNPMIKPIMNLKGAAWCLGLLKPYIRGNNIITDIRSQEYKIMMLDHIEAIWLNIGTRDDLGVKEEGDLIRVGNELEHAASLVLMGAGDGRYKTFLGTTYSHHTTSSNEQRPNMNMPIVRKKSAIDKLKNLFMGDAA